MEETNPKRTNKIDYSITPISFYKFVCEDENIVSTYVGHTANFTRRKNQHKFDCNTEKSKNYNFKLYQTMRANGGWDNWRMIEIKSQLCESKRQAVKIEQELIDQYKAELNTRKAFGAETKQEYKHIHYIENKEIYVEQQKQYVQNHKKELTEYYKNRYIANKEKIAEQRKEYIEKNKDKINERQKEYRLKNKEKLAERKQKYYQDNKEKVLEENRQYRLKKKAEKEEAKLKELV
jgi:hypothetical protein